MNEISNKYFIDVCMKVVNLFASFLTTDVKTIGNLLLSTRKDLMHHKFLQCIEVGRTLVITHPSSLHHSSAY